MKVLSLFRAALIALLPVVCVSASPRFDIELDPADFAFGGHRIHAGYIHNSMRFDLGALSAEIPRVIHGNEPFDWEISGFVARADFLFGSYPGWFAGMEGTFPTVHVGWTF